MKPNLSIFSLIAGALGAISRNSSIMEGFSSVIFPVCYNYAFHLTQFERLDFYTQLSIDNIAD